MVKSFFKNSTSILFRRQTTILSAAAILMVLVLASRILGLIRNRILAGYFGAGPELDIYNASFVLPDLITNLLITGALSVAFIPIFTSFLVEKKEKEAWEMSSSLINFSLVFFSFAAVLIFIFANSLTQVIVPGYTVAQQAQVAELTRFLVFAELLLILGNFFTSILQSFNHFVITALAPVMYNLGIIAGILWLTPLFGVKGVAFGVILGALLHLIIQVPLAKSLGFNYRLAFDHKNVGVRRVAKLSLPRVVGVGLGQFEWVVSIFLASLLTTGSVTILKFSFDLQNFPIGLFGVTIATAALPTLSVEWANKKAEEFKETFLSSLHQIMYLAVPMSVILIVLRIPVTRLILGSGKFDWSDTVHTATTLSFFALGIFAQASFLIVARAFYAMHDTLTPVKVAFGSLLLHILLSIFFVNQFGYVAYLALASSFAGIFSFLALLYLLNKKIGGFDRKRLVLPAVKTFLASVVMGISIYIPVKLLDTFIIDTTRTVNLVILVGFVTLLGLSLYLLVTWWLKSEELAIFTRLIVRLKDWRKILAPVEAAEKVDSS
ncbi:MAG: murein biosynthesis integral membrane protein MurJ [Patescibacteria group bacterium]|nr:murein biosynthesis integral membrane protein MurJ [Patescibacteria group bacterium]